MKNALILGHRFTRVLLRSVTEKPIHLRRFTMGSTDLRSASGNGKPNTWQGLGAAEFDLRSKYSHLNTVAMCIR